MKINQKKYLDNLLSKFKEKYSSNDPIWYLHKFKDEKDIEIIGLIASSYAYGQIDQINRFISNFLKKIGKYPSEFISNFNFRKDKKYLINLNYRFNNEYDLMNIIENIRVNNLKHGSLKTLFLTNYFKNDKNILNALNHFSKSLRIEYFHNLRNFNYLIPDVSKNSTCKRLNLFLRWMVRKDEIDLGIWRREADKSKLIIPVDTHVYRVSRKLGLIKRNTCDIKFAIELTNKLKEFDDSDPVKYDFALCHSDI